MKERDYIGWAVKCKHWEPDGSGKHYLQGILFDHDIRKVERKLGIRTMVYQTREQARRAVKKSTYRPGRVVKVRVSIKECA